MRLNTQRVKDLMETKNLTPEMVAFSTGMTLTSINWILRNGFISDDALERIASVLMVPTSDIYRPNFSESEENEIEFLKGDNRATVTFSQGRFITKIKQLAEEYPEEVRIIADNKNKAGNTSSLCASLAVAWIVKPGKPRELTEEQKEKVLQNLRQSRNTGTAGEK